MSGCSIASIVTDDGRTLHIEFLRGPPLLLWLTRDEACALLATKTF